MSKHFDESAKDWDKKQRRIVNAQNIAAAIRRHIDLQSDYKILDFGTGTGLLAWELSSSVGYILGVDTSEEMLKVFADKDWVCRTDTAKMELDKELPDEKFDGIISSMTLHHVKSVKDYLEAFYQLLKDGGFIAIADLDKEDGSFHTSGNEGVFHLGFQRKTLKKQLEEVGFQGIEFDVANVIEKETAEGEMKKYPVFLVVAKK